jgi:iron complex outermembrane receptor protein
MGSVQLAYDQYQIQNEKFLKNSFSIPYWFVNPRIGVNYNMTDEWNSYFSFGYTSREPRLRNLYSAEDAYWDPGATPQFRISAVNTGTPVYDYSLPLVKPEELLDFELGTGYKSDNVAGTANVYWMEFTHELVKSGQVDIFGNPVYGNADRTRHIGFEFDGSVQLPHAFSLSGNFSLSVNRIIRFTAVQQDSTVGSMVYSHAVKLDGNPIAGFPDLMGNVRLGYQTEDISAGLSLKCVGLFFTDNFKNALNQNDAYTVVNFESLYKLPRIFESEITLRAEIRNLLNKLYMQTGEGNAFFPAAERNYLVGISVQL